MRTRIRVLAAISFTLILFTSGPAPAQSPPPLFTHFAKGPLPGELTPTSAVVLGDVDRDGDLDAVVGRFEPFGPGARVRLWLNDGEGRFSDATAARMPSLKTPMITCLALADVDGDGDLDILEGNESTSHPNHLFLNDGKGYFKDGSSRLPAYNDITMCFGVCDVDMDGDVDLVVGNGDQGLFRYSRLFLNDGKGNFLSAPGYIKEPMAGATKSVVLGDIDGDGDPDLVAGNPYRGVSIYLNDGKGVFTPASYKNIPTSTYYPTDLALGDVDRDGDLDLLVGKNQLGTAGSQNRICLNDGKGVFTDATAKRLPSYLGLTDEVLLVDLDRDGDLDLVEGDKGADRLYLNDGKGFFRALPLALPINHGDTRSIAAGDVDGDGSADLLVGVFGQDHLYLNDGKGLFQDAVDNLWPEPPLERVGTTVRILLGDLDRDGDTDVIFFNDRRASQVYVNQGWGRFKVENRLNPSTSAFWAITGVMGDFDGDGDPDLVTCDGTHPSKLLLNDGKGYFTDATAGRLSTQGNWKTSALAAGDVDGDGDLDLVFGNGGIGPWVVNRLFLNDGKAHFREASQGALPSSAYPTTSLVLADFDGDGDLDLVAGNYSSQDRLFINDGKGRFTDKTTQALPRVMDRTTDLAAGDVDGDGDLDLVTAVEAEQNRLYINDGKGRFADRTPPSLPKDRDSTYSVALGDVDGDGDLDIVFGNNPGQFGQPNRLLLNDGKGGFLDASSWNPAVERNSSALALGDLDVDGDLDLLLGEASLFHQTSLASRVSWNVTRHLFLPWPARPGKSDRLDIYAWSRPAGTGPVAIPLLSARPGSLALPPLGYLRLDPALILTFAPQSFAPGKGRAEVRFAIPKDPVLAGRNFYFQGLVLPGANAPLTTWRFTNPAKDTVWGF